MNHGFPASLLPLSKSSLDKGNGSWQDLFVTVQAHQLFIYNEIPLLCVIKAAAEKRCKCVLQNPTSQQLGASQPFQRAGLNPLTFGRCHGGKGEKQRERRKEKRLLLRVQEFLPV